MFRNPHFDRLRQAFADQFLRDEHGVVYRKYQKGAPIRVSEAERDRFIAAFGKRIRFATWAIFPATVALISLLVWLVPDPDSSAGQFAMWLGLTAILMPFLAVFYWAWNSPSRELERRTPLGAALTKEEARALSFSKVSYGQLALAALMGAGLVWQQSRRVDVLHGWGVIWLAFAAALVIGAGIQAIRKWRFDQR